MIYSMTAFARRTIHQDWGSAIWEIRSVNHRYLEVFVKLPETLRGLEPQLREHIRKVIQRGKVECYLKYQSQEENVGHLSIDTELVKQLATAKKKIKRFFPLLTAPSVMEILNWPGVVRTEELPTEVVEDKILQLFDAALKDLAKVRQQEGQVLTQLIQERLKKLLLEVKKVKQRLPNILKKQREKLIERFEEAKIELDKERLEQEMVFFSQRSDISEEIDRLELHAVEVKKVLEEGGAVGRRLDFLMQELHREANTLGSKAVDAETSATAVELKTLIEQMREQVQNVE